jgi:hypothetical protein
MGQAAGAQRRGQGQGRRDRRQDRARQRKVGNFQLCKSMDRVAALYRDAAKKSGQEVKPATDTPACADPGAFTYTPPSAKPAIEAAGAHSPAKTATAPPSSTTPQSAMPAKK